MSGNGLIVAFFALAFLAFCLTAVALYALSRDKDDAADKSISGLTDLRLGSISQPKQKDDAAKNNLPETDSE
jgi:predicted negative regulator of RcsB-dependent stress response